MSSYGLSGGLPWNEGAVLAGRRSPADKMQSMFFSRNALIPYSPLQQPASYIPIPTSLLLPIFEYRSQVCSSRFPLSFYLMSVVGKAFHTPRMHGRLIPLRFKSGGMWFLKGRWDEPSSIGQKETDCKGAKAEHRTFTAHQLLTRIPFNIIPRKLQSHGAPTSPPL